MRREVTRSPCGAEPRCGPASRVCEEGSTVVVETLTNDFAPEAGIHPHAPATIWLGRGYQRRADEFMPRRGREEIDALV